MSGHNICFCSGIRKIIFELSSILLLIWSSVYGYKTVLYPSKITTNIKISPVKFSFELDFPSKTMNRNLDLYYKTDLDFWECSVRGKPPYRALDKRDYLIIIRDNFCLFCIKMYVVTPHLNRLVKTVQIRGHNIWFC